MARSLMTEAVIGQDFMLQERSRFPPLSKHSYEPIRCCVPERLGGSIDGGNFYGALGSAAAGWPLAARAQQPERMRRIGVLMGRLEGDTEGQARMAAFWDQFQKLGWMEGRTIRIDIRWQTPNADSLHRFAKELVALRDLTSFYPKVPLRRPMRIYCTAFAKETCGAAT